MLLVLFTLSLQFYPRVIEELFRAKVFKLRDAVYVLEYKGKNEKTKKLLLEYMTELDRLDYIEFAIAEVAQTK